MIENPFLPAGFFQLHFDMLELKACELTAKALLEFVGNGLPSELSTPSRNGVRVRFPNAGFVGGVLPLTLDLGENDRFMLSEHLAAAKLPRLLCHSPGDLWIGLRSKRRCALCELLGESIDVGCNRYEFRAIVGKIMVVAQGEEDGRAAIFGGSERRSNGLRELLVLDSNLGKGFLG